MFYDIFLKLCAEKGVTPYKVSKETGINQSTIAMWKKQGTNPGSEALIVLAEYFDTTPAYLMGNKLARQPDNKPNKSDDSIKIRGDTPPEVAEQKMKEFQDAVKSGHEAIEKISETIKNLPPEMQRLVKELLDAEDPTDD